MPRGLGVRDRLRLAGQAALAHEAAEREARRVGELARLLRAPCTCFDRFEATAKNP